MDFPLKEGNPLFNWFLKGGLGVTSTTGVVYFHYFGNVLCVWGPRVNSIYTSYKRFMLK